MTTIKTMENKMTDRENKLMEVNEECHEMVDRLEEQIVEMQILLDKANEKLSESHFSNVVGLSIWRIIKHITYYGCIGYMINYVIGINAEFFFIKAFTIILYMVLHENLSKWAAR